MALQASLATSKILIIVGASIAGSVLVKNGNFSDFLDDTYKVLVKHLKNDSEHAKQSSLDPNLLSQLTRLRQELSSLASERSSVTIVSGSSGSNGSFLSFAVPAVLIGVTGYGYMRWKGFSLSDFMYVTRRSMSTAVSSVSKQLEHVSTALQATKRQLTSRLEHLSSNLDQNLELQAELKNEVILVRGDVEKYGREIETVQRLVQSLGVKIDTIESKQDEANNGVMYLCNFVEKTQSVQPPESIQGFQKPRLQWETGSTGFKDFKNVLLALESTVANEENLATSNSSDEIVPTSQSRDEIIPTSKSSDEIVPVAVSTLKGSSPSLQRRFTTPLTGGLTRSFFLRT